MEGFQIEELESEIETLQMVYDEEITTNKTDNLTTINYITKNIDNNHIKITFEFNTHNKTQSNVIILVKNVSSNSNNLSKKSKNKIKSCLMNKFKQETENMPIYQCIDYFNNEIKSNKSLFTYSTGSKQPKTSNNLKQKQIHKSQKSTKQKPIDKKINHKHICIKCGKKLKTLFSWSVCGHLYCTKCAGNAINTTLLSYNSIPKCIYKDCNEILNICDGHKISKSLLPKYQMNKSTETHYRESILFYGYMRLYLLSMDIELMIPKEIIQLMSDYFALLSILTRIKCYGKCSGKINISECDCIQKSTYKNGKYVQNCSSCVKQTQCINCNGHGKINKNGIRADRIRIKCFECKGKGVQFKQSKYCKKCESKGYVMCGKCKGFGTVSLKCICNGSSYLMALDFEKLYKRQINIA